METGGPPEPKVETGPTTTAVSTSTGPGETPSRIKGLTARVFVPSTVVGPTKERVRIWSVVSSSCVS